MNHHLMEALLLQKVPKLTEDSLVREFFSLLRNQSSSDDDDDEVATSDDDSDGDILDDGDNLSQTSTLLHPCEIVQQTQSSLSSILPLEKRGGSPNFFHRYNIDESTSSVLITQPICDGNSARTESIPLSLIAQSCTEDSSSKGRSSTLLHSCTYASSILIDLCFAIKEFSPLNFHRINGAAY